jgi:hypothetical protein
MFGRFIASCSLFCIAEVLASLAVWTGAPKDWVGQPPHFWSFEAWRVRYWLPAFLLSILLWLAVWYAFHQRGRKILLVLLAGVLPMAAEALTSIYYWKQIPHNEAQYLGWSYFPKYFGEHLFWWVAVVSVGFGLWHFWVRRRAARGDMVTTH